MVINAGMLHTLIRALVREMKPRNGGELQTEAIGSLVIAHAAGAAAASFAAGFLPGAGGVAALVVSAGFIWSMYYRICKELDIQLSKNKAKALGADQLAGLLTCRRYVVTNGEGEQHKAQANGQQAAQRLPRAEAAGAQNGEL